MAKILVADFDLKNAKAIQQILISRDDQKVEFKNDQNVSSAEIAYASPKEHLIFHVSDYLGLLETASKNTLDMIFVNSRLIDLEPKAWIEKLMKAMPLEANKSVSLVALTAEEPASFARRFMNTGFQDVVHSPIDAPIFLQKFDLLLLKKSTQVTDSYIR